MVIFKQFNDKLKCSKINCKESISSLLTIYCFLILCWQYMAVCFSLIGKQALSATERVECHNFSLCFSILFDIHCSLNRYIPRDKRCCFDNNDSCLSHSYVASAEKKNTCFTLKVILLTFVGQLILFTQTSTFKHERWISVIGWAWGNWPKTTRPRDVLFQYKIMYTCKIE